MFDYEDDEPTPQKNAPLIKLYERLCALQSSLPGDITSRSLTDGAGERLNGYIEELIDLTNDTTLRDFKVQSFTVNNRLHVKGEAYARQLEALTNFLYKTDEVIGYYCGNPPALKTGKSGGSGFTTVNNHLKADQQVSQSTSVQIELTQNIMSITEALTKFEQEYPDESSKENRFVKIFKKGLPMVKDSLSIVALALKVAGDVGIDPHTTLKALGLDQ